MSFVPTIPSGIIWDPMRLGQDEREIEFLVRKINSGQSDAVLRLAECWQKEESGTTSRPVHMHSSLVIPQDELEICENKLRRLSLEVDQLSQDEVQDILPTIALRVYHVCSRLVRLSSNFSEFEAEAENILIRCQQVAGRLIELRSEELNRSRDVAAGVSLPMSQTDDTTNKGAVPKSTHFSKSKRIDKRRGHVSIPTINKGGLSSNSNPMSEKSPISYSGGDNRQFNRPVTQPQRQNAPFHNPFRAPQRHYAADVRNQVTENVTRSLPRRERYGSQTQRPLKTIDKWQIKYSGATNDMAVDEFVFRAEAIARSTNTSLNSLVDGIHFLLTEKATTWYWIHVRTFPNQDWYQFKRAIIERFSVEETDAEIRMAVENRKQLARESFGDFALSIQQLLVRLQRPVSVEETVDILRRNMSQRLKEALLMHNTRTVDELHSVCRRFEKLWSQQPLPRLERRINELELADNNANEMVEVCAVNPAADYVICWNCRDIGHVFQDCTSAERKVFCYGCGTADTYKPTCRRCTPAGNGQGNPRAVGPRRPIVVANQDRADNQERQPNPFRR